MEETMNNVEAVEETTVEEPGYDDMNSVGTPSKKGGLLKFAVPVAIAIGGFVLWRNNKKKKSKDADELIDAVVDDEAYFDLDETVVEAETVDEQTC